MTASGGPFTNDGRPMYLARYRMVREKPHKDIWSVVRSDTGELVNLVGGKADGLTRVGATILIRRLLALD